MLELGTCECLDVVRVCLCEANVGMCNMSHCCESLYSVYFKFISSYIHSL